MGTLVSGNLKVISPNTNGVTMSRDKIIFPDGSRYDAVTKTLEVTRRATFDLYRRVSPNWFARLFGVSESWQKFAEIKNGNGRVVGTKDYGVITFRQI